MIVAKNKKVYNITESNNKWLIKSEYNNLSVVYEVSKELCNTSTELKEYILNNNDVF